MKTTHTLKLSALLLPLFTTGCLNMGTGDKSIMISELTTICGAIVGSQAEERINQEWNKYPSAAANRDMIEIVANVLLTNPDGTPANTSQYKKYLTCATGMLMTQ